MRYARFARRYKAITVTVPITIARVTFLSGLRTSPAAKAMLCHESAEKSDPVWLTHNATNSPNAVPALNPEEVRGTNPRACQRSPKLARKAVAFFPIKI